MLAAKASAYCSMPPNKDLRSLFGHELLDLDNVGHSLNQFSDKTHSVCIKFQIMYQRIGDTPTL